jgi:hypothetical protein
MAVKIEDNAGGGAGLRITDENQAKVQSESHELQHHVSINHGQVYQVIGGITNIASGINTALIIKNTSANLKAIISFIRLQVPGLKTWGTTHLPDENTYWQMGRDTLWSSGGVAVEPVNMNFASGNVGDLECYKDGPTVTGTFQAFDEWYPNHDMMTFNKQGSLILGLNDAIEIRLVTDNATLQKAYCRVTIMLKKNGNS